MNRIFRRYLDSFVVVFIDDILEYLANHHGLRENSKRVLDVLSEKNLFAEQMKCAFSLEEVSLLCHVVSKYGNAVHPKKIEATVEWERPTSIRQIRSFSGIDGFNHRFVVRFSTLSGPLTPLIIMNAPKF